MRRVIRVAGGVLEFPDYVAGLLPVIGVGDVGVVGDGIDDVEDVGVDEVVAEAGVEVGVGRYGGHNVGVNVEVVPHITIEGDNDKPFRRHGSIYAQAAGDHHLRLNPSQPTIILPGRGGMLVVVLLLN